MQSEVDLGWSKRALTPYSLILPYSENASGNIHIYQRQQLG